MNLETAINTFVSSVCAGKINETPSAYRQKLRQLNRYLGADREIINITHHDLDNFRIYLLTKDKIIRGHKEIDGHLSPFTILTTLSTTRYLFRWLYRRGLVAADLSRTIELPKKPKPRPKAIESEAAIKMLKVASETGPIWARARNLAIIYVLRDTGGRVGGLVNALVDDLEMDVGQLMVVEKGDVARTLFLNPHTILSLRLWLHARQSLEPKDRHLFVGMYGHGLSRGRIYNILRETALKAGIIGRYNPHSFRHAFARDTLRNGSDLSRLSEMMGHSTSGVTTEYYAVWDQKDLQELHKRVSPGVTIPLFLPVDENA